MKTSEYEIEKLSLCESKYQARKCHENEESWASKPLHRHFLKQTEEGTDGDWWRWLRRGEVKKETDEFVLPIQDRALRVMNPDVNPNCRKRRDRIVSSC